MDECRFELVPADLAEGIKQASRSLGATKLAEDAFNVLRDKTRHAKSGAMGRRRRYHTLLTATLLDDCGRGVDEEPTLRGAPGSLDMQTLFEKPDANQFSLGEGYLEDYMTSAEPMSAAAHLSNHMVWSSIVDASGHWDRLKTVWLSVLAPRGLLVRGLGGRIDVVLYSSVHGMLLLRCNVHKQGDLFPQVARAQGVTSDCSRIFLSTRKASTKPLLEACADTGFRQLTVPLLQRLIDELKIPFEGKRPTLEREVAALVVQWVYPAMAVEEVDALVELRKLRKAREFQSVITEENAAVVEEACGDERGDQDLVQDTKAEALISKLGEGRARVRQQAPRAMAAPSSSSSSGADKAQVQEPAATGPRAPAVPAPKRVIEMRSYTAEEARVFIPQDVKGCSLSVHTRVAWMVTYRTKPDYPRSHSCTFTLADSQSEFEALLQCLVWVWRVHKRLAGVDCPWDLGTPI